MSINASPQRRNLKNKIDQKKFSANCSRKTNIAILFVSLSVSVFITMQNAIPINVNRIAHTTVKTDAGGTSGGFIGYGTKEPPPPLVTAEDRYPTPKGNNNAMSETKKLFFFSIKFTCKQHLYIIVCRCYLSQYSMLIS